MSRPLGSKNKITKVEKKPVFSVTLQLNGKEYPASADTLLECLQLIKPEFYKTRGALRITKGEKKSERLLNIPQLKRLFGEGGSLTKGIAQTVIIKYAEQVLK